MELSLSLGFARREEKDGEEESSIRLSLLPSSRSGAILEASRKDFDVNSAATSEDQAVTRFGNSEEEENGSPRKKLRLSKEQSAFLEESFKEHKTLNPKQKVAVAKQLNLGLRQVEVWFQNRRARSKLKQTEVDCEYLKRCCENLTDENRRLHKELAELRALKTHSDPFSSHLSATTLSMCPSCERTTTNTVAAARQSSNSTAPFAPLVAKPPCFAASFAAS